MTRIINEKFNNGKHNVCVISAGSQLNFKFMNEFKTDIQRIERVLKEKDMSKPEFQKKLHFESQHWNNWRHRGISRKRLEQMAKYLSVSMDWLATGEAKYSPSWLTQENNIKENGVHEKKQVEYKPLTKLNKFELIQIPLVKWHEIGDITNPNHRRKEFNSMPVIKGDVSAGSFAIEIDDNQYSPYLNDGEAIVVEPVSSDTRGKRVLVNLGGQFHLMEHTMLEREYFVDKKSIEHRVPITDDLD